MLQQQNEYFDCIQNNEVCWVEDVKDVFHFRASALTVIKGEERNGKEREPLQVSECDGEYTVMDSSYHQQSGYSNHSPQTVGQKVNGNGQKDPPHAVVDIEVSLLQENWENENECCHGGKCSNREQAAPNLLGVQNTVYGIDGNDGERKGNQNSLVEAFHSHKVNNLKSRSHSGYEAKVFCAVFGISATLCDHISEDREGDSAQNAKDVYVREKPHTDMVKQHTDHSNDFELIIRKTEFWFWDCFIHNCLTRVFLCSNYITKQKEMQEFVVSDKMAFLYKKRMPCGIREEFWSLYVFLFRCIYMRKGAKDYFLSSQTD